MNVITRSVKGDRGVTLIELLVSIAIIAVLLSIGVVAIGKVRESAAATKSVANLRQIGFTLGAYASAHRDEFPFLREGEGMYDRPPEATGANAIGFSPVWVLDRMWPALMHDVAPWPEHFETWLAPRHAREPPYWPIPVGFVSRIVSYDYSNAFLGNPRIWNADADASERDISATKRTEVTHPSAKVVMFDAERPYLGERGRASAPRPVLMVDGSASLRRDADAAAPVRNPLNELHMAPRRYHDTPNGIDGRDF